MMSSNEKWLSFSRLLSNQISIGLPGIDAQLKMAPVHRINEIRKGLQSQDSVKSSVLILLFLNNDVIKTVVMLRPSYDGVHSGQISLPGGKWETSDIDLSTTALRETHEEIGIPPYKIRLIGQLSPLYIPPSNFIVYPFIGISETKPEFIRDPMEVQEIIELDIAELLDRNNATTRRINFRDGTSLVVPCYVFGETIIWGATAMILSEFTALFENIPLERIFDQTAG
jgi:8-oxo-dGTP pyrophosphatase MutT (NUDIX family)